MKVASVVFSKRSGGIGPVCKYAASGMAECRDWRVTLACLNDSAAHLETIQGSLSVVDLGLERNNMGAFLNWLDANPQDVIISSGVSELEPYFPCLPERTAHIVQIHDSSKRYREAATRYAPYIDGVVTVAHHIQKLVEPELRTAGFGGLVSTVHNGACFPKFCPRSPRQLGQTVNLLFMGSMDPLKGADDLLPLLKQLRKRRVPANLRVVGGDNAGLKGRLERAGFSDIVSWAGRVPHEHCYKIASESDVLINPTRKESFGMVTIEAMSMGCIPVAYDIVSGNREIIEHEKNGFLVPLGSTRRMSEVIEELYLDPSKFQLMSGKAAQRARESFSDSVMSENMAAFVEKVISNRKNTPAIRVARSPTKVGHQLDGATEGYRRMPNCLRTRMRRIIGRSPRLSYWLAQRS
jgi:glycosyltransferase involved in cell wall biosynthesis